VPAAVTFCVNACKNGPLAFVVEHFEDDSIEKIGQNVLALWPPCFDAMFSYIIDTGYSVAEEMFGPDA
jgi:hypothetical protein